MTHNITIKTTENSTATKHDINNIPMGKVFTDHMFVCDYRNGKWENPRVEPLAEIKTHPAAMALHYGQAIFEGLKATMGKDGPMLFRPHENAKRLNLSADRMGMPSLPEEIFVEGLKALVSVDHEWVPSKDGSALYLRPFMYADEAFIGMRAATSYKFIIMASPAGPFFSRPVKLYAETKYVRAVNGGTGEAKAAGNYAGAIRPTEYAKEQGYDQVLWLDAHEFEYIQEVGTMNIFFKIGDKFITPNLNGSVLAGITRMSVIALLRDRGFEVEERPIRISEVKEASENGTLKEAFGVGTAVGIALIEEIGNDDFSIKLPKETKIANEINQALTEIRSQRAEDKFGWMLPVDAYSPQPR